MIVEDAGAVTVEMTELSVVDAGAVTVEMTVVVGGAVTVEMTVDTIVLVVDPALVETELVCCVVVIAVVGRKALGCFRAANPNRIIKNRAASTTASKSPALLILIFILSGSFVFPDLREL